MSGNDTDEWASMIINEICDETKAFEKILKHTNTDDNEANEKGKLSEISYREDDLSQYVSANYKKSLNDSSNKFGEEWTEPVSSSKMNEVSSEMNAYELVIQRFIEHQDLTSESNLMVNVELKEEVELSEVATEPVKIAVEKNYDISESEIRSKSFKEEAMLVDLDEAFIQDVEIDGENADESGKSLEVSVLNGNIEGRSKCFSEISSEELVNLDILSFRDRQYENKDEMNDYSVILDNEVTRNSAEQLHLCNDGAVSSESFGEKNCEFDPMQDKNEFKTGNVSSISADLESISGSSEEYIKRIDKKIKCIGFRKSPTVNSRSINRNMKRSNSATDLYCEWFKENYIKEETEYGRGSDDEVTGKKFLAMNRPKRSVDELKSYSVGENLNANKALNRRGHRYKKDLNENALNENFVRRRKSTSNKCTKGKFEVFLEQSAENVNEIFTEKYSQWLEDIDCEKYREICRCSEGNCIHNSNECNKIVPWKKNNDKSIFTCKSSKSDPIKDDSSETVEEMDDEELEIRNRRVNFVISTYRDMCSTWETIFVRPFANVFADTYEFLAFVFFLSLCLLYFLYDRVQIIISNHKLLKMEKSPCSIYDEKEKNVISDYEQPTTPVTGTDVTMTDGIKLSREENVTDSSSMERNEIVKLKDMHLFVKIEPKEVEIVYMDYELVTENLENAYEKIEKILTVFCNKQQHMSTVKTNEDGMIDFKLININEKSELLLNENDFDMEILASSKRLPCNVGETGKRLPCDIEETVTQREGDNVSEVLEQYEDSSEIDLGSEMNSRRPLPGMSLEISCRNEKPLLNSPEVSEQGAFPKYKTCSHLKALSASDITYSRNDSLKTSPGTSMEGEYLNCSLKVNLSSFSSRSDILSDSIPLLINSGSFHDDESMDSAENIKISDETKIEAAYVPDMSMIGILQDVSLNDCENNLRRSNEENLFENYFDERSTKPYLDSPRSEGFQISSAADVEFHDVLEGALMCGDAKFIESLSSLNDRSNLSLKDEAAAKKTNVERKSKNSLRRRMSLILNNWKNVQVMPCVMKNPKNKKNYRKHDQNQ